MLLSRYCYYQALSIGRHQRVHRGLRILGIYSSCRTRHIHESTNCMFSRIVPCGSTFLGVGASRQDGQSLEEQRSPNEQEYSCVCLTDTRTEGSYNDSSISAVADQLYTKLCLSLSSLTSILICNNSRVLLCIDGGWFWRRKYLSICRIINLRFFLLHRSIDSNFDLVAIKSSS